MKPRIGDYIVTERLGAVEVIRIHPLGTYDVRHPESDRYFRISGLNGADWRCTGAMYPAPGTNFAPMVLTSGE